jgi:hypothetical protein
MLCRKAKRHADTTASKPFIKQNQNWAQASSQDSGGQQHGDEFVHRAVFPQRHSTSMSAGKKGFLALYERKAAQLYISPSLSVK